jgi:hypothetical protein
MLPCGAPGRLIIMVFIKTTFLFRWKDIQNIEILVFFNEKITLLYLYDVIDYTMMQ